MLTRRIARPLLASWFIAEGIDAFRRPGAHAARAEVTWARVAPDNAPTPTPEEMRRVVKAHGAAMTVAAVLLALGKAPRVAGCALALLTVPLAVADAPSRTRGRQGQTSAETRRERGRFLRDLSLIGGAALAGLDREGRPSLGWRMQHSRVDRAAELQARRAVSAARHEAKDLARALHRS